MVFATSLIKVNDTWYLYYGAADTYVGVAIAKTNSPITVKHTNIEAITSISHVTTVIANKLALAILAIISALLIIITLKRLSHTARAHNT